MKKNELEAEGTVVQYDKPVDLATPIDLGINEADVLVMVDERMGENMVVMQKMINKQMGQMSNEKYLKLLSIALRVFSKNVFVFITGLMTFGLFGYSVVYKPNPWTLALSTIFAVLVFCTTLYFTWRDKDV